MLPDTWFMPKPESTKPGSEERRLWIRNLGLFSLIVSDIIGYTGAGIGIGYLLWAKLGAPWWVLVLTSTAGLVGAMYRLYLFTKKNEG